MKSCRIGRFSIRPSVRTYVCPYICPSVHPFPPSRAQELARQALDPASQASEPARQALEPLRPELAGSKACLAGSWALEEGNEWTIEWLDEWINGWMDRWMENLPILQDFVPYRGCCLAIAQLRPKNCIKRGKGTTEYMMLLGNWLGLKRAPLITKI